jgi:hypothetical protein
LSEHLIAASVLALAALSALGVWRYRTFRREGAIAPATSSYAKAVEQRIDELQRQSFDEVLELACTDGSYYSHGHYPPHGLSEQDSLRWGLQNRRCVRVLEELRNTAGPRRSARANAVFEYVFDLHKETTFGLLAYAEDETAPRTGRSLMPSRSALAMALVGLAEGASTDSFRLQMKRLIDFQDVVEMTLTQRHEQFRNQQVPALFRHFGLVDHRALWNTLMLHFARTGRPLPDSLQRLLRRSSTSTVEVLPWNAMPPSLGGKPPDPGQVTIYKFYDWPDAIDHDKSAQRAVIEELLAALAE